MLLLCFFKKCKLEADDVYTPPKFNVQNGSLQSPLKWLWNYYNYYKSCKKTSSRIIENEKPNIVVSDEDFASISVAQEKNLPTILITDILQTSFTRGIGSIIERKNESFHEGNDKKMPGSNFA